jgi:hypothetical protein
LVEFARTLNVLSDSLVTGGHAEENYFYQQPPPQTQPYSHSMVAGGFPEMS